MIGGDFGAVRIASAFAGCEIDTEITSSLQQFFANLMLVLWTLIVPLIYRGDDT